MIVERRCINPNSPTSESCILCPPAKRAPWRNPWGRPRRAEQGLPLASLAPEHSDSLRICQEPGRVTRNLFDMAAPCLEGGIGQRWSTPDGAAATAVERRATEVSEGDGGLRLVMPAPAKVNLVLCIGGARDDGFHDLVSIFQAVEIRDTVILSTSDAPEIRVTASDAWLPCDERNTAYRAARLLRDAHAPGRGVEIHLEKRIPAEAGLGGGSSDAAAVLQGLNALWGLGLSTEALLPFAAEVGSDVPFFLSAGCALVRGRGERVEPLPCSLNAHLVVAKPAVGVSTARAYADLDILRAGQAPEPCDEATDGARRS